MPYDRGRHDRHTTAHQQARYHLRAGMARVALQAKAEGKAPVDAIGRPLKYATEMMERHSLATLARWADGRSNTGAVASGMDFCPDCHRVPEACVC